MKKHLQVGIETHWKLWGLGIEIVLGEWVPEEWGIYLVFGPLIAWITLEEKIFYRCTTI